MFRRFVATFVIVGLCASQWAAIPHAHRTMGQGQARAHAGTPHLHLSWFHTEPAAHEHGHSGHDHGHFHHKHPEPSPTPSESLVDGSDHDADALYFPAGTSSFSSSDRGSVASFKSQVTKAVTTGFVISAGNAADSAHVNFRQHPPETRARNCALFLELRILRI
jgi:hypothetical protein